MKTIEEKARAYDRAKDIMEKYLKSGNAGVIAENTIKNAFPELHENEDEIVKEELINYLKHRCNTTTLSGEERACNKWIAWLEKQGEQTDKIVERAKTEKQRVLITESDGEANIDWDTRSLQDVKLLLEYGLDYIKKLDEKNCLSNTKHSMGDLKIISSLKNIIHTYWNNLPDSALEENEVAESCYRWLEKQGQRRQINVTDKELAQARKEAYNEVLDKIEYHDDWPTFDDGWNAAIWYLKKRNGRPQLHWKPSAEQMKALHDMNLTGNISYTGQGQVLIELYNDLKKL